jgi:hypothetical protein
VARRGWQGETGESTETLRCAECGQRWRRPAQGGRRPRYCSDACKQHAYRSRQAAARARSASAGTGSGGASGARESSYSGGFGDDSFSYSSWSGAYQQDFSGFRAGFSAAGGAGSSRSSSSSAAGGGQRHQRSEYHARSMSASEARRTIFRIAELRDDGATSVKKAYRRAARILHPDQGATAAQEEQFRLLSLAKSVLEKAGLYM